MTIDWTIGFGNLLTVMLLVAGGVAAWVTMRWKVGRIETDIAEQKSGASTQMAAVHATLKLQGERIEDVRAKTAHELAEFKLEVAKDYAGHIALREMEARLVKAIDAIADRLDRGERKTTRTTR